MQELLDRGIKCFGYTNENNQDSFLPVVAVDAKTGSVQLDTPGCLTFVPLLSNFSEMKFGWSAVSTEERVPAIGSADYIDGWIMPALPLTRPLPISPNGDLTEPEQVPYDEWQDRLAARKVSKEYSELAAMANAIEQGVPVVHGMNWWGHSIAPWPQPEPERLHEPSETDLMISDRFEELGFNWLAQVFRGTATMPGWVVRLMQNGPATPGWTWAAPENEPDPQPLIDVNPSPIIIDELNQPDAAHIYRERDERVIDARD